MVKNLLMTAAVAAMALGASAETKLDLGLDDLGSGWNSTYDAATKTITYEGSWTGKGWWLGSADYSDYDKVVVEFAECNVPVQLVVEYNNGVTSGASGCVAIGSTEVEQALSDEGKGDVMQIYLQCGDITGIENPTVTLSAAYVVGGAEYNPIIFDGEMVLSGWAGNEIAASKFAQAEVGDRMVVTCKTTEGGSFKINLVDSNWNWIPMTSFDGCEGYSEEYETIWIDADCDVECTLNESDVNLMLTGRGAQVQGDGVTITQIAIYKDGGDVEYPAAIYVVGNADGLTWDLPGIKVEGFEGIYDFKLTNASSFKFSTVETTDWAEFNAAAYYVAGGVQALEVGTPNFNKLTLGDADNNLPYVGDYEFQVQLDIPDSPCMYVTALTAEPVGEIYDIYLRGKMNDWEADPAYRFSSTDGIIYTLAGQDIAAGVEFKIADASWGTINYGGVANMELDQTYVLEYNTGNCSLAEDAEDVTLIFNYSEKSLKVSTTGGIGSVAADNDAETVYYNLQGIRVENPENGIFVKRQGNKATTIYVK